MNEQEARERIKQMISFVQEEAKDKAREIETRTEHEYNAAKSKHLFQAKEKLVAENAKKWKNLEIKRRIDRSAAINAARMEIMKARSDCMSTLVDEARAELAHRTTKNPKQYKTILENLIVQGLIKMLESHIKIQCRASDAHLVQEVVESSKRKYVDIMKSSTGKDYDVEIEIDSHYLPPGPGETTHGPSCAGGVILTANHGKIRCINTLDERLKAVVEFNTPGLRKLLFS